MSEIFSCPSTCKNPLDFKRVHHFYCHQLRGSRFESMSSSISVIHFVQKRNAPSTPFTLYYALYCKARSNYFVVVFVSATKWERSPGNEREEHSVERMTTGKRHSLSCNKWLPIYCGNVWRNWEKDQRVSGDKSLTHDNVCVLCVSEDSFIREFSSLICLPRRMERQLRKDFFSGSSGPFVSTREVISG